MYGVPGSFEFAHGANRFYSRTNRGLQGTCHMWPMRVSVVNKRYLWRMSCHLSGHRQNKCIQNSENTTCRSLVQYCVNIKDVWSKSIGCLHVSSRFTTLLLVASRSLKNVGCVQSVHFLIFQNSLNFLFYYEK